MSPLVINQKFNIERCPFLSNCIENIILKVAYYSFPKKKIKILKSVKLKQPACYETPAYPGYFFIHSSVSVF